MHAATNGSMCAPEIRASTASTSVSGTSARRSSSSSFCNSPSNPNPKAVRLVRSRGELTSSAIS